MDFFLFFLLVVTWIFFWIILQISEFFFMNLLLFKFPCNLLNFLTFFQISEFPDKISKCSTKFSRYMVSSKLLQICLPKCLPIFLPDFLISFFLIVLHCPPIFYGSFINFFQTFPWNLISEFVDQIWYSPEFLRISWPIFCSQISEFLKKKKSLGTGFPSSHFFQPWKHGGVCLARFSGFLSLKRAMSYNPKSYWGWIIISAISKFSLGIEYLR